MLADSLNEPFNSGALSKTLHLQSTALYELINFIAGELPRWRERPDRKNEVAENTLTSQLCAHLSSAARRTPGWDFLQFRIEEPDQQSKGRKLDLVPAPCDAIVMVDGRRYIDFDPLLPIECKRLPIPKAKDRDEREYVINREATTGGIQRFKAGHHGAAHTVGAMIAYVQEETPTIWHGRVTAWIEELAEIKHPGWSTEDLLFIEKHGGSTGGLAIYRSSHTREKKLPNIELRHLWIVM